MEKTAQFLVVKKKSNCRIKTYRFKNDKFLSFAETSNTNYAPVTKVPPSLKKHNPKLVKHKRAKLQGRMRWKEEGEGGREKIKGGIPSNHKKIKKANRKK